MKPTHKSISYFSLLIVFSLFFTSCGIVRTTTSGTERVTTSSSARADGSVIESGIASWYGSQFHGKLTANGETYNMNDLTAAHKTLPFNTVVRVENRDSGKSVVVRINDRGPYVDNRIIDLSRKAAREVDMEDAGTANVQLFLVKEGDRPLNAQNTSSIETFTVQLASYNSELEAKTFSDRIEGARVEEINVGGRTVYRVYYGTYETANRARRAQQRLAEQGHEGFVKQAEN